MKKIALILGAVIVSTGLFAQKANVKKAADALYEEPVETITAPKINAIFFIFY